jgi:hypothetical protein
LCACGGAAKTVDRQEAEPAWVASYVHAVDDVCACTDDRCTRERRTVADQILAAHGGVEEAPPSAQEGFKKLEHCWVDLTRDLARDLEALSTRACACTTFGCWEQWQADMTKLARKYVVATLEELRDAPTATASSTAQFDRAVACLEKGTISSERYLAIVQAAVDEMCACKTTPCAKDVMGSAEAKLAAYFNVGEGHAGEIEAAKIKLCQCQNQASVDGEPFELSPGIKGQLSITMSCR